MEEAKPYFINFEKIGRKKVSSLFGWVAFLLLIMLFVDGLFPQLQILVFKGDVIIPSITLKVILIGTIYMLFIIHGSRLLIPKILIFIWLIFVLYLMLDTIYFVLVYNYSLEYMIFNYNPYYFFLLISPFFSIMHGLISEKSIVRFLFFLFVPLAILGLAQFFFGNPIVPIASSNNYFEVMSWNFYGKIRAFSLFGSGSSFGHFIALVATLSFVLLVEKKEISNKLKVSFIFLLAIVVGYATLTRNTYLEIVLSLLMTFLFIVLPKLRRILKFVPFLYGFAGFLLIFVLPQISNAIGNHIPILSSQSLNMRFGEWHEYSSIWLNNISSALFGTAYIQNSRFAITRNIIIDNAFLAVGLQIGLIGLLVFLFFMCLFWLFIYKKTMENPTPLHIGVMGVFSTWMMTDMFAISIAPLMIIGLILFFPSDNDGR